MSYIFVDADTHNTLIGCNSDCPCSSCTQRRKSLGDSFEQVASNLGAYGFLPKFAKLYRQAKERTVSTAGRARWCVQLANRINGARAVQRNRYYAKRLHWETQIGRIGRLLGVAAKPSDRAFAKRVAIWQCAQNLLRLTALLVRTLGKECKQHSA